MTFRERAEAPPAIIHKRKRGLAVPISVEALARQVKECRKLQRAYFITRDSTNLALARDAERRLDRLLETILHPPELELFAEE